MKPLLRCSRSSARKDGIGVDEQCSQTALRSPQVHTNFGYHFSCGCPILCGPSTETHKLLNGRKGWDDISTISSPALAGRLVIARRFNGGKVFMKTQESPPGDG